MSDAKLRRRVDLLEQRAEDTDSALETLTDKVNEVRQGNARILKNLGVLMAAQDVAMVELTGQEADDFD